VRGTNENYLNTNSSEISVETLISFYLSSSISYYRKNLISIFLAGLREDLRGKVKLDEPVTMDSAYRLACARESIATAEKKWVKPPFLNPSIQY